MFAGIGFRAQGLRLRVESLGLKVWVGGFRVGGLGFSFRVEGLGFRVLALKVMNAEVTDVKVVLAPQNRPPAIGG